MARETAREPEIDDNHLDSEVVEDDEEEAVDWVPPRDRHLTTSSSKVTKRKRYCRRRYIAGGSVASVVILICVVWFVPLFLDPTQRSPYKKALDRKWVDTSPYFFDRMVCRWFSLCGLHHLRGDPASRKAADDKLREDLKRLGLSPDSGSHYTPPSEAPDDLGYTRRLELRRRVDESSWKSQHSNLQQNRKDVPDYVLKYAPLVHLHDSERFWPSDIAQFIQHVDVSVNGEVVKEKKDANLTLDNLNALNRQDYWLEQVSLHSHENVESRPDWLYSHVNIPFPWNKNHTNNTGPEEPMSIKPSQLHKPARVTSDAPSYTDDELKALKSRAAALYGHKPDAQGYSGAPAILILVDKGNGVVDAFWFFFYAYNFGQTVLGVRFGNHVADWEHCLMRFKDGKPTGVFLSEHEGGLAYAWESLEKRNETDGTQRPIVYSAIGSHAMYATPGYHPYIIPFNLLRDATSAGPLWDPALNNYAFHYDFKADERHGKPEQTTIFDPRPPKNKKEIKRHIANDLRSLVPASSNKDTPTNWFFFRGAWGDDTYSLADRRQWRLFGQYHYVRGPAGPRFKKLGRSELCSKKKCRILRHLNDKGTWHQ